MFHLIYKFVADYDLVDVEEAESAMNFPLAESSGPFETGRSLFSRDVMFKHNDTQLCLTVEGLANLLAYRVSTTVFCHWQLLGSSGRPN